MSAPHLSQLCTSFVGGNNDAFKEIIANFLELPGVAQKDLARDCEVAISTVSRWGRGVSIPGRHVQEFVVKKVRARI